MTLRSSASTSAPLAPKSSSNGAWIGVGAAIGVALGVAFDNIGLGIAMGVAIGAALEFTNKKKN